MGGALKPHNVRYAMQRQEQRRGRATMRAREARLTPEQRAQKDEAARERARALLARLG